MNNAYPFSQHRRSRIAVPARRTTMTKPTEPGRRSNSLNRQSSLAPPSSAMSNKFKTTRSRSVMSTSHMTPLRTPMRTPNRFVSMTPCSGGSIFGERRKTLAASTDKINNDRASTIMQYLKDNAGIEFTDEHIRRGSLKNMSVKQFLAILTHFFTEIGIGKVNLFPTSYVEEVITTLNNIEYIHTITKSTLKTPSSPHSITHIITLFDYLYSLIESPFHSGCIDQSQISIDSADPFINSPEMMLQFHQAAEMGFQFWNNNQDEEFKSKQNEIAGEIFVWRTSFSDENALINRIESLKKDIQELSQNMPEIDENKQKNCNRIMNELESQSKTINELKKSHDQILTEIDIINENMRLEKALLRNKLQAIDHLKAKLNCQDVSKEEFNELINKKQQLGLKIESHKNAEAVVEQEKFNLEVEKSNLVYKRNQLLEEFKRKVNILIHKAGQNKVVFSTVEEFDDIVESLKQYNSAILNQVDIAKINIEKLSTELKSLVANEASLKGINAEMKRSLETLKAEMNSLEKTTNILREKKSAENAKENDQVLKYKSLIENIRKENDCTKNQCEKVEESIDECMDLFEKKSISLQAAKREKINQMNKLVEEVNHKIDVANEELKILKNNC